MRRILGLLLLACAACDPVYRDPRPTLIPRPMPYEGAYSEAPDALALVGCYRAATRKANGRIDYRWYFTLDTLGPVPGRPGGGEGKVGARRVTMGEGSDKETGYWGKTPEGIQMYFGNTLHGVWFELDVREGAEVMDGRSYGHSDTSFGFGVQRIAARRIPCSADGSPS